MLKIGQLAQIKGESPYVYEALTQIVNAVNSLGRATGVDPSGTIDPPAPIGSLNVTSADGIFDLAITDNSADHLRQSGNSSLRRRHSHRSTAATFDGQRHRSGHRRRLRLRQTDAKPFGSDHFAVEKDLTQSSQSATEIPRHSGETGFSRTGFSLSGFDLPLLI